MSKYLALRNQNQDAKDVRRRFQMDTREKGSIQQLLKAFQPQTKWQTHNWANYNDLTATSLEIIVSKGNHPQMALIQVSELL